MTRLDCCIRLSHRKSQSQGPPNDQCHPCWRIPNPNTKLSQWSLLRLLPRQQLLVPSFIKPLLRKQELQPSRPCNTNARDKQHYCLSHSCQSTTAMMLLAVVSTASVPVPATCTRQATAPPIAISIVPVALATTGIGRRCQIGRIAPIPSPFLIVPPALLPRLFRWRKTASKTKLSIIQRNTMILTKGKATPKISKTRRHRKKMTTPEASRCQTGMPPSDERPMQCCVPRRHQRTNVRSQTNCRCSYCPCEMFLLLLMAKVRTTPMIRIL